ncbi:hypothetical protein A3F02_03230 [Candidatus Curtissbacteria bacterium RIFCSPHIGHO2_12_FULL_38_9b]|uniref:Uncharacterized protein n=1 Tax=Candidatus Curtissbacteria bacterium RIFCSPHIGHO2_12_FULL_38_9b TaxID=1797720 RepID=A0A1F5GXQ9_9BACT|nr:MAG: hypothetical protein A3F02_03230 [Candidatus Curtissbacteria bacterium RIFCSPHIGHO2_12_FULL_38_9b]
MDKKPNLKLINNNESRGYTISNIKEVLSPKKFAEFEKWMRGQTVGMYKGEGLVYQYDFERFLEGLPVLD